jgi:catechol 2,3-dioxygenase-like lactoylglutathione lyase family enzyme
MSMTDVCGHDSGGTQGKGVDLKLEVVVIPVSDVDRAKEFYTRLGWRLDTDLPFDNGFRVVQFTPPGSGSSLQFGTKITLATPGSAQNMYLIVSDIEVARDELAARGVEVTEVFHPGTPGAQFQPDRASGRISGPAPDHASYSSFATLSDPDGATDGFCRRSPHGYPAGSRRQRPDSHPPRTWRVAYGAQPPPTASMRSASGRLMRTGQAGTPLTWLRSKPGRSYRRERLRRAAAADGGSREMNRRRQRKVPVATRPTKERW